MRRATTFSGYPSNPMVSLPMEDAFEMELGPWAGFSFADAALFFPGRSVGGDSQAIRPASRKKEGEPQKQSNRVLMLGRMRELALYRAEVLRSHGFEVIAPETEEEALSAIAHSNFDVAILSYTLPDSSVRQFAELIRQRCPGCSILAIAQTMQYDRRIEPDSIVLADNGPSELLAALRRLLRGQ